MAETFSLLANIATAFGIPIAIWVFVVERRRYRRDLELDTYRTLSDKYFEYLRILIDNPNLSSTETDWIKKDDGGADVRQHLLVQLAVNLIETAFFLYRGHDSEFRRAQWVGWQSYLRDWCTHPAFVEKWPEIIDQYDADFRECVRTHFEKVHGPKDAPPQGLS